MPEPNLFHLLIVSPDRIVLETEAKRVFLPGPIQEIAVLPDHTPLYSELIKGVIRVETETDELKEVDIEGGIVRVRQNQVSVILGFEADIERPT